jgi:hypothetical protein
MERIKALIDRLHQQQAEGASLSQLLATTQLLQQELLTTGASSLGTAKVAVRLPNTVPLAKAPRPEPIEPEKAVLKPQEEVPRFAENKVEETKAAVEEAPTFIQHATKKEIHERIAPVAESLNDRLKESRTELAQSLKESPIRDLKKGIGINDRFTFVSELFRGDEAMYERSIKTINNFNILSEAEYWISRELKLKLGWNDTAETVQHFYSLVRRRFI